MPHDPGQRQARLAAQTEAVQAELFAKERADGSRTTPFEGEAALKALSP